MPTVFNSENSSVTNTSGPDLNNNQPVAVPNNQIPQVMKDRQLPSYHTLPGHTHNPLAPYCYYPDKVTFVNKEPEEKVVLLLRKHPITNLGWISIASIMFISPAFLTVFSFFDALPAPFKLVLTLIWYLITLAYVLEQFLSWFFQVNFITDERVIDVNFVTLMYREMSDANIEDIQEVTVEMGGAIRTFFNYGNVLIQTAAEQQYIDFEAVPNPDKVAQILRELRMEEEVEKMQRRIR